MNTWKMLFTNAVNELQVLFVTDFLLRIDLAIDSKKTPDIPTFQDILDLFYINCLILRMVEENVRNCMQKNHFTLKTHLTGCMSWKYSCTHSQDEMRGRMPTIDLK